MFYYLETIEQVKNAESETGLNEYAKIEKIATESLAYSKYYTKLANVSNSDVHTYMFIQVVNSLGTALKRETFGKYLEELPPEPSPEPEPEEEPEPEGE